MNQLKQRVYINIWNEFKPYDKQAPTDLYYLNLSNEVKHALLKNFNSSAMATYLEPEELDYLACFLTSYFEDLISQTNIWSSFIRIHKRLYGKVLPFYDAPEYFEDEINFQDVCFLIWYYVSSVQDELVFPFNSFIFDTADDVMNVFDDAWEFAPENKVLKAIYELKENVSDYYKVRGLIDRVLLGSYLFYPDIQIDFAESELEIIREKKDDEQLMFYLNENRDLVLSRSHTRLLGLTGKEWVSEILGESHPMSDEIKKLSRKIMGFFFYKGQDDENVFIEHIASGKKFNLTKKSFDHHSTLKEIDTIMYLGIVNWKNEWWFSGILVQSEFDADLVMEEKNSLLSRKEVSFLDYEKPEAYSYIEKQFEAFKAFNNGSQIAFMQAKDLQDYINRFMKFYNESLDLSEKERKESLKRARSKGYLEKDDTVDQFAEMHESALVFFNPKAGIEIGLDVNGAFPAPNNPFYTEKDSDQHVIRLLLSEDLSPQLVRYCIDHFSDQLPLFQEEFGKIYLQNQDFLLRFFKRGNYFTKPEISFT